MSKNIKFLDQSRLQQLKDQDQYFYIPQELISKIEKVSKIRLDKLMLRDKLPKKLIYKSEYTQYSDQPK